MTAQTKRTSRRREPLQGRSVAPVLGCRAWSERRDEGGKGGCAFVRVSRWAAPYP